MIDLPQIIVTYERIEACKSFLRSCLWFGEYSWPPKDCLRVVRKLWRRYTLLEAGSVSLLVARSRYSVGRSGLVDKNFGAVLNIDAPISALR